MRIKKKKKVKMKKKKSFLKPYKPTLFQDPNEKYLSMQIKKMTK